MIDAVVAGNFIGPDALTAINLVMPLTTLVAALSTLIGIGPAIMAAKAIGGRNTEKVNSIFSSAMYQAILIGLLQAILLYFFLPQVGTWLCPNQHLLPYLMEYIQVMPFTFFLIMIVTTLVSLIEADGHPNLATKAVALGSVMNIVLDVVLVKFFDAGIQGLALAMFVNYLSVFLFFLFRMKPEGVSYRWTYPKKDIISITMAGLKEGTPMMLNDLIYSLMLFGINSMLLMYFGETELYFWAVFLQLLLFVMVIVDCAEGAMLSIGSVLEGEDDMFGLRALVRRSWLFLGSLVFIVVLIVFLFPDQIAQLFGERGEIPEAWPRAARILSLMLLPYALSTFMRSVFQVLGNRICGVIFSCGQLALIVLGLYASGRWNTQLVWWSLSIASWVLFAVQVLYLMYLRRRNKIREFSFIPLRPKVNTLDLSVAYNREAVIDAVQRVCKFLNENKVSPRIEMEVNICCEELMMNILTFQTYKTRSYMDMSVVVEKHRIFFVLKDPGRPFNPIMATSNPDILEEENAPLGLFLVNRVTTGLTHKYMYGLNVVFAEFTP